MLLTRLKSLIPNLEGALEQKFSAAATDHRAAIRTSIAAQLSPLSAEENTQLKDLRKTPRLDRWSVSISHCRHLGGWIARRRPGSIGFDLEHKSRIEPHLIARIATPSEIALAPYPELLWCAKESYFKAIEVDQPVTFTGLKILKWVEHAPGTWRFNVENSQPFAGWVLSDNDLVAAICVSV